MGGLCGFLNQFSGFPPKIPLKISHFFPGVNHKRTFRFWIVDFGLRIFEAGRPKAKEELWGK
jgi:hypothetical protein